MLKSAPYESNIPYAPSPSQPALLSLRLGSVCGGLRRRLVDFFERLGWVGVDFIGQLIADFRAGWGGLIHNFEIVPLILSDFPLQNVQLFIFEGKSGRHR